MNRKNIGKNLKTLRKQHNMTQAQLAKRVNVSTDHLSHAEAGVGSISLPLMIKICDVLGVTPDDILAGEYEPECENSLNNAVITLNDLDPHYRILFLELYQSMKELSKGNQ